MMESLGSRFSAYVPNSRMLIMMTVMVTMIEIVQELLATCLSTILVNLQVLILLRLTLIP